MTKSKTLIITEAKNILSIELHRPEVRNAFDPEMIAALTDTFLEASKDKSLLAVLLHGSGAAFCAGADLSWMQKMVRYSQEENLEDSRHLHAMFSAIWECEAPVISYAHGSVFGGGLGMLACSDLIVAAPDTQFCFSEVKLGLSPAVISDFIAKRGLLAALQSAMTFGSIFSCAEALAWGLVQKSEVWSHPQDKALEWVGKNGAAAMRETKSLLRKLPSLGPAAAKTETTELISRLRVGSEAQTRLQSFLEGANKKGHKA